MTQQDNPDVQGTSGMPDAEQPMEDESPYAAPESTQTANRSTMLLLGLILIGGAIVYFMYMKTGPRTASAASAEAEAANTTINQFLSDGGQNIKAMEATLRNTEKFVHQFRAYPAVKQVPLSDLKANPFSQATAKGVDPRGEEEAARKQQAEERQQALRAVQNLQLQSIMHSETRRACMINNTLYLEGQQIEQFTIEKISPGAVIVRNGPYRFELKMTR